MTVLIMPDGTTFAAATLDTLAEQWAAWVHGHGWAALSEAQQEAATRECGTRLRQLLGVEITMSGEPMGRSAADRLSGPMSSPSTSHSVPDRQTSRAVGLPR